MEQFITTSIFDFYKIGPGPSSSHTIGPMKIALNFLREVKKLTPHEIAAADRIEVHLYGSLSATGKGHGTDRAVLAGLLGWEPETCDDDKLLALFSEEGVSYNLKIGEKIVSFSEKNIHFDEIEHSFPHRNTVILQLLAGDRIILQEESYSLGGGFIEKKGEKKRPIPRLPYLYSNMNQLKVLAKKKDLAEIILENEMVVSGLKEEDIFQKLEHAIEVIENSVERGLETQGVLQGPLKLERKACNLFQIASSNILKVADRFLIFLDAYALAAAEENAAGRKIVACPTSGASGVIAGIVYLLRKQYKIERESLMKGLLVAAAIGFIIKHNASISGSDVGCQGEVGAAASMGAALLAYVNGNSVDIIENAAEIAMEHNLGMTCDPIAGYVQIPCIERNAVGAMEAYNAYLLAAHGDPKKHKISLDQVIRAMYETGQDMSSKYKETSLGGLAKCEVYC